MAISGSELNSTRALTLPLQTNNGKIPLAIALMNAELPPFKNGEDSSESASTLDRGLTPLPLRILISVTYTSSSSPSNSGKYLDAGASLKIPSPS